MQKQSQDNLKKKQPKKINFKQVKKQMKDNSIMDTAHQKFLHKIKKIQMQLQRVSATEKLTK